MDPEGLGDGALDLGLLRHADEAIDRDALGVGERLGRLIPQRVEVARGAGGAGVLIAVAVQRVDDLGEDVGADTVERAQVGAGLPRDRADGGRRPASSMRRARAGSDRRSSGSGLSINSGTMAGSRWTGAAVAATPRARTWAWNARMSRMVLSPRLDRPRICASLRPASSPTVVTPARASWFCARGGGSGDRRSDDEASSCAGTGVGGATSTSAPSCTSSASRMARAAGNRSSGSGCRALVKNAARPGGSMSSGLMLGDWPGSGTLPSNAWRPAYSSNRHSAAA